LSFQIFNVDTGAVAEVLDVALGAPSAPQRAAEGAARVEAALRAGVVERAGLSGGRQPLLTRPRHTHHLQRCARALRRFVDVYTLPATRARAGAGARGRRVAACVVS